MIVDYSGKLWLVRAKPKSRLKLEYIGNSDFQTKLQTKLWGHMEDSD